MYLEEEAKQNSSRLEKMTPHISGVGIILFLLLGTFTFIAGLILLSLSQALIGITNILLAGIFYFGAWHINYNLRKDYLAATPQTTTIIHGNNYGGVQTGGSHNTQHCASNPNEAPM